MNCLGGQTPINSVRVTIKPLQLLFIRTCALLIVAPATAIIFSTGLGLKLPMLEIELSCVLTKNSGRSVIWLPGSYSSAPSSLLIQYSQRLISLFYIFIRISSSLNYSKYSISLMCVIIRMSSHPYLFTISVAISA